MPTSTQQTLLPGLRGAFSKRPDVLRVPVLTLPPTSGTPKPFKLKLHPEDNGSTLLPAFLKDPLTFVPPKNRFGETYSWGVWGYKATGQPAIDGMQPMMRHMATFHMYLHTETPELQWVNALMCRKEQQLAALDVTDLGQCDYIIRITLQLVPVVSLSEDANETAHETGKLGEDLISRRFKVSGGIKLDTLQDKIIQPIMGWARNEHAYIFTDFTDGASYGPAGCEAVDMQWISRIGYAYMPAGQYTLAHLVQNEGQRFGYFYDFGDAFAHVCEIEKILPPTESDSAVQVLEGRGMCPAEDCGGDCAWNKTLHEYKHGTTSEKQEIVRKVYRALNYRGKPLRQFDPFYFSPEEAKQAVISALGSAASVRACPKVVTMMADPSRSANPPMYPKLKKGQKIVNSVEPGNLGVSSEVVSERKDSKNLALCAVCGNPNGLKVCARCHKVYYCSVDHQRVNWSTHKADCQTNKKSQR